MTGREVGFPTDALDIRVFAFQASVVLDGSPPALHSINEALGLRY